MKKLMVSGALALAFSGVAMAEESGAFVGVDLGLSNGKMTRETMGSEQIQDVNFGFRYGLMGGYKWFFTESFGLRAYLQVNNGSLKLKDMPATPNTYNTLNVMANVDALWNFYTSNENAVGLFAGLSLGYAIHNGGIVKQYVDSGIKDPSGFDMGINFGVRSILAKHHGIEIFSRFGVVGASATSATSVPGVPGVPGTIDVKMTTMQPYAFGVRYTFNF
ncbi:outer membrane beta-barrel protein [uncultured Helicobacter sp.]|uniref:outer membrane beta-barrel protein n=1 Tax=uncultured Helicobacter sp. TaxID=175537 RepID=UPI001C3BC69D|nr:outer membrane protein [Candidatus Helicobacter avicola]